MTRITIVGCGVVGAAIAYELSRFPHFEITVLDRQLPAQEATGAALGVMMGIISQKTRGTAWELRQASMKRYETLIPELEAIAGTAIPWNRQGIVKLVFDPQEQNAWAELIETRRQQGWQLHLWDREQLQEQLPQVNAATVAFAIYSPQDRQIDPVLLTRSLVTAAQQQGVTFRFDTLVQSLEAPVNPETPVQVHTHQGSLASDWVILSAGLGTDALLPPLPQAVVPPIRPVLGQALHVKLPEPLGRLQPVITGNDIHVVPLPDNEYWVGATVEFPDAAGLVEANPAEMERVLEGAIALCPALQAAVLLEHWSGSRPRPHNAAAPVIQAWGGDRRIILATGHYRNGVLLAPATAQQVATMILSHASETIPS